VGEGGHAQHDIEHSPMEEFAAPGSTLADPTGQGLGPRLIRRWLSLDKVVRPGSWIKPVGASPTRVIAGEPGSRPRFVVERRRAERGVKCLFGGSKRAGRSATRRESCSLVTDTTREPSRSLHGEGSSRTTWRSGHALGRVPPGYGERHVRTA